MILRPEPIEYEVAGPCVDREVRGIRQKRKLKDGVERERVQGRIMLPTEWVGADVLVLLMGEVRNEMQGVTDEGLQFFGVRTGVAKPYNATRAEYGMIYLPGQWVGKKVRCYLLSNLEQFSA